MQHSRWMACNACASASWSIHLSRWLDDQGRRRGRLEDGLEERDKKDSGLRHRLCEVVVEDVIIWGILLLLWPLEWWVRGGKVSGSFISLDICCRAPIIYNYQSHRVHLCEVSVRWRIEKNLVIETWRTWNVLSGAFTCEPPDPTDEKNFWEFVVLGGDCSRFVVIIGRYRGIFWCVSLENHLMGFSVVLRSLWIIIPHEDRTINQAFNHLLLSISVLSLDQTCVREYFRSIFLNSFLDGPSSRDYSKKFRVCVMQPMYRALSFIGIGAIHVSVSSFAILFTSFMEDGGISEAVR